MYTIMDNSSASLPANDTSLNSPGFMVYSILLVMTTVVACVMIGFTIFALIMATSVPRPVRLFLINLLIAGLQMVASIVMIGVTSIVFLNKSALHPRPLYLCRMSVWVYATGVAARLWSLAAFSFAILAIVKFGKKTISLHCAAVIIPIMWLGPMILSINVLITYVYEVQFVHGVACFPDRNNTIINQARYTFFAVWSIFGGLTPLTVSIVVPIVCLCYIRKNIVTEGTKYRKAMAKLSLFLVVGGGIGIAGQILPVLISLNSEAPGVYVGYGIAFISLLPSPIIILVFLKPRRLSLVAYCIEELLEWKASQALMVRKQLTQI